MLQVIIKCDAWPSQKYVEYNRMKVHLFYKLFDVIFNKLRYLLMIIHDSDHELLPGIYWMKHLKGKWEIFVSEEAREKRACKGECFV